MRYETQGRRVGSKASGSTFSCRLCGKHHTSNRSLRLHRMVKHANETYQCRKCDKKFANKADLSMHSDRVHGETKHKCEDCDRSFLSEANYQKHNKKYHGNFPCLYPNCKYRLDTPENLKKHHDSHQEPPQFPCKICGKKYAAAPPLQIHMETVHSDTSCSCTVEGCSAKYLHPVGLKKHIMRVHNTQFSEENSCKICGKGFRGYKRALINHMNTVHWLNGFKKKFGKDNKDGENEDPGGLIAPTKLSTTGKGITF